MQLKDIIKELLEQELDNIVRFPSKNFTVSIDRPTKKLIFAPEQHMSVPSSLRTVLNVVKQNFRIVKVTSLEDEGDIQPGDEDDVSLRGSFEVEIDPREDFEAVIDFLKNQVNQSQ